MKRQPGKGTAREHGCCSLESVLSLLGVARSEWPVVLLSSLHFFFLLAGYYIMRSIRDAVGLTGGIRDLKLLFFITLAVMIVANPLLALLVSRFPRRVFVPVVYVFFISNLLIFYGLFRVSGIGADINVARAFFIWVSVFNLFVVSLFWGMTADLFRAEQGQRLFGLVSVGGTLGAIAGSASTVFLAQKLGTTNLLPLSIVLIGAACGCAFATNRLERRQQRAAGPQAMKQSTPGDDRIGGGAFSGLTHVFLSPYLLAIAVYILCHSFSGTLAYFLQGTIVESELASRDARTQFFAMIDLNVNVLAVVFEVFLTGRIIRTLGVGWTLAFVPMIVLAGFAVLGFWPQLTVLYVFQVVRRGGNFALSRPAREALFTVVPREDKFKAKNMIDTVAYRGGDAAGVTWFSLLTSRWLACGISVVLWCFLPIVAVWCGLCYYLGRRHANWAVDLPPVAPSDGASGSCSHSEPRPESDVGNRAVDHDS